MLCSRKMLLVEIGLELYLLWLPQVWLVREIVDDSRGSSQVRTKGWLEGVGNMWLRRL